MATRKDVRMEVARLNKKYCKGTKNKLALSCAYGGCSVVLTGKQKKRGGYYKGSLQSGAAHVTYGYLSAKETLFNLYKADSTGDLKKEIKSYEKK